MVHVVLQILGCSEATKRDPSLVRIVLQSYSLTDRFGRLVLLLFPSSVRTYRVSVVICERTKKKGKWNAGARECVHSHTTYQGFKVYRIYISTIIVA